MKESKFVPAEAILKRVVGVFAALPPGNTLIGVARGRWGRSLMALHREKEGEEQLIESYHLMKAQPHPPANAVRDIAQDLINYYNSKKDPDKAKAYLADITPTKTTL